MIINGYLSFLSNYQRDCLLSFQLSEMIILAEGDGQPLSIKICQVLRRVWRGLDQRRTFLVLGQAASKPRPRHLRQSAATQAVGREAGWVSGLSSAALQQRIGACHCLCPSAGRPDAGRRVDGGMEAAELGHSKVAPNPRYPSRTSGGSCEAVPVAPFRRPRDHSRALVAGCRTRSSTSLWPRSLSGGKMEEPASCTVFLAPAALNSSWISSPLRSMR